MWDVPGLEKYHGKNIFLTEALTIEAKTHVDQAIRDNKLFFLYMSHYAVHVPFAKDVKTVQHVDGISFVPLLKQATGYPVGRALYWHCPNNWGPKGPGIGPHSTIRKGDWKLIYYHTDQRYELFNLAVDISETNNLASSQPERLRQLASELGNFLVKVDAQIPTDRRTGKPVPFPGQ